MSGTELVASSKSMGIPPPVASRTASLRDLLREAILNGQIGAGTRLRQAELTKIYGVSLTPVREALRELTAEGLLDETPFAGVAVHSCSLEEFEEINRIKIDLIPLTIREALSRVTDSQLRAAWKLVEQMDEEPPGVGWVELNRRFHHAMNAITNSRHLTDFLRRLDNIAALYVNLSLDARNQVGPSANDEHRELLDAFDNRDEEAAINISVRHITGTLEAVRQTLKIEGSESSSVSDTIL